MGLSEIIYMKQSGKIHPEASLFDILFTRKMGQESITTATGNPVSIVTNKAQNAISTILSYSPKQTGSGDPSPQNIRPIVGWTEANLGVNSETPTLTTNLGGTYYGFSIDLERGVLTVYDVLQDMGDLSWLRTTAYDHPVLYSSIADRKISTSSFIKMCDTYFPRQYAYGSASTFASVASDLQCAFSRSNSQIFVRDDSYTSGDAFKTAMRGHYLIYELATPIEIDLTPQTVALLAGNNTLWTDGDSITIKYRR